MIYLNAHTHYSLRYGTLGPEALLKAAVARGVRTLVITDVNCSTGCLEVLKLAQGMPIQVLAGIDFWQGEQHLYVGIAHNLEGFRELNTFYTYYQLHEQPLPARPQAMQHVTILYPFGAVEPALLQPHERIGIRLHDLNKLAVKRDKELQAKSLLCLGLTYEEEDGYLLHKHLRAIEFNTLLSQVPAGSLAQSHETWITHTDWERLRTDYPALIRQTEAFVDRCEFDFDFSTIKNKKVFTSSTQDDLELLTHLALEGANQRYGKGNKEAIRRVKHELKIINQLGFSSYFLITWDIVRYSMGRGYYHVGRGSGANSVVAYCLRITDVDPIELDLYFERFLNPKRSSPPDFDIDYAWHQRDDVLDYIFKRYGRHHTALLGTMNTFVGKSIIRELGKVYGLPKGEIDLLVTRPKDANLDGPIMETLFRMGQRMTDMPNLRSIHAGGVLITEEPIYYYTALDLPPKGFPTVQWDMYTAEDLGFEKFDILSQRGLGHIQDAVGIIADNQGKHIDIHAVEKIKHDPQVQAQLKTGDTIGCFYVESPAMRQLLKKLRCEDYLTLVAASSIIRPGVSKSGMMKEYIYRFHNPGKYSYIHPIMQEQLQETYGVMVYQEDVLKVCHHFAGLDLADADVLRRAMSGKYRSKAEFQRIVEKFHSNCAARGYPEHVTKEVWRQVESFAGYSFSKAHSASFAVESFQSLYLKAYFPLEFMVAVINNFGGFYKTWTYVHEARMAGGRIHLPCVQFGQYLTSISGSNVYLGLVHVEGLEAVYAKRIIAEREEKGAYIGLEDFVNRTEANNDQLFLLAKLGALRFMGQSKKNVMWQIQLLVGSHVPKAPKVPVLFDMSMPSYELPVLPQLPIEDAYDEIELLGFPISCSFFDLLQTKWRGEVRANNLLQSTGQIVKILGQMVTTKNVQTVKGDLMQFGTFLDVEGVFFDTVHFPDAVKQYPFNGIGVYLVEGTVINDFGYPLIEVLRMAKLPIKPDPRAG